MLSSEYLNNVLMSMAGSLIVIGPDTKIKTVNQATLDLTGYTEEELVGQPIEILLETVSFSNPNDTLSRHGFIRHGERTYKTKNGKGVPVSFSSSIMRDQNKRVLGIVCVAQDISLLKKMENEVHKRLEQLGILHQVDEELTHNLSVRHVAEMGLDITMRLSSADAGGIALMQDNVLIPVQTLGYPAYIAERNRIENGIVERVGRRCKAERIIDIDQDSDYMAVLTTTRAMIVIPMIAHDNLIGVLHLETDNPAHFTKELFEFLQLITARIAAAADNARLYDTSRRQLDELQRLYSQVSNLEQIKTDMIRIAAHDLRNPLTSITLSTYILRKTLWDQLPEKLRDHLIDIERSAERMRKITSNILSLERINKTATGEFQGLVDLNHLVQQVYEEHQRQAKNKEQVYTLEKCDESLIVQGDEFELHEAAANFVGNALKYTPEKGNITLVIKSIDGRAIFEVKDSGYGIPSDQQTRLFQPFYRVHTAETENVEGTGLGLHLVKNIIERHKGFVRFTSKHGEGSTFGFELPLIKEIPPTIEIIS